MFAALLLGFSACEKDEGTLASSGVNITFRTDSGYTYANDSVPQGDTVRIGAIITQGSDPIQWFFLSVSLDSGAVQGKDTVHVDINPFTYEAVHVMRTQPGTEQVIFTVQEPDGDRTTRRLIFTVP
jgi:hypothetical protein